MSEQQQQLLNALANTYQKAMETLVAQLTLGAMFSIVGNSLMRSLPNGKALNSHDMATLLTAQRDHLFATKTIGEILIKPQPKPEHVGFFKRLFRKIGVK